MSTVRAVRPPMRQQISEKQIVLIPRLSSLGTQKTMVESRWTMVETRAGDASGRLWDDLPWQAPSGHRWNFEKSGGQTGLRPACAALGAAALQPAWDRVPARPCKGQGSTGSGARPGERDQAVPVAQHGSGSFEMQSACHGGALCALVLLAGEGHDVQIRSLL
jgi:hypothetical protein